MTAHHSFAHHKIATYLVIPVVAVFAIIVGIACIIYLNRQDRNRGATAVHLFDEEEQQERAERNARAARVASTSREGGWVGGTQHHIKDYYREEVGLSPEGRIRWRGRQKG